MTTINRNIPSRRIPAEWDSRFTAVMLAWPHSGTDWNGMLDEVDKCYSDLAQALEKAGQTILIVTPEPDRVRKLLSSISPKKSVIAQCPTNDTWTRDYGLLTIENIPAAGSLKGNPDLSGVSYKFNGWGLKFAADKDNMVNFNLQKADALQVDIDYRKAYTLEGGSIESDGNGTIMTTAHCMLSFNRNGLIRKEEVEKELTEGLGAERVLWLDHGNLIGDDTDSHVDTLARLAPHDTILYVKSYDPEDPHTPDLEKMEEELKMFRTAQGNPYNLIGLPLPSPIHDEDGERLPATYANFLITPRAVLMPVYGQPRNDEMAAQMMRIAFPAHEIITVDCRALIRQHGSLHCATMQFPAQWLPI